MASLENRSDAEVRAQLIAAARVQVARKGRVSFIDLYAECGVDKAGFHRCFSGEEALLASIVHDDVQALHQIAVTSRSEVQSVAQVGGAPVSVTPMPAATADAWLERRLRVFERALSALENRQEKSEREVARGIAQLEEKMAVAPAAPLPASGPVSVPSRQEPSPQESSLIDRAAAQFSKSPDEAVSAPIIDEAEPSAPPVVEETAAQTPVAESFTPEAAEEAQAAAPAQESVSGREIEDFIAHARVAANRAAEQKPEPQRSLSLPRWIGWMGVAAIVVVVCVGFALGHGTAPAQSGPGYGAAPAQSAPGIGVAYRAEPHDALGRLVALADSGDARAQTVLALAYLRGQMGAVANDAAARRWSLAAAQQGVPMAQYVAGTLTSRDDAAQAFSWFEQAALRGNVKAMHNLAIAYAQGDGTAEDDRRAAAWFNRAANQGYVDSQFDLAVLFERGQGVAQNRVAALKWYIIAAKGGDGPSKSRAEQLQGEMPADEIVRAAQLVGEWRVQPRDPAANAVMTP